MKEFPVRFEREVRADSPEQVYHAVAALFQHDGYDIRDAEQTPPRAAGGFRGGFRAIRDTVLDADKRRQGYMMLAGAAALTVVMLAVYALEITTNRFVASAPLLPIVLLGGWGLGRLREPAQRVRRIVDTRFGPSAQADSLHLVFQAGVGKAEGQDGVSGWIEQKEPPLDTRRLDEVLGQFQAA